MATFVLCDEAPRSGNIPLQWPATLERRADGGGVLQHVSLAPGQTTSFRLGVSHGGGSDTGCSTAYGLQVIAPNDTAALRVPIPNGASECGTTTVSPLQPGDSAYQ